MKAKDLAALLLQHPEWEVGLDDYNHVKVAAMNNIKVLRATTRHDTPCLVIFGSGFNGSRNIQQYGIPLAPDESDEPPQQKQPTKQPRPVLRPQAMRRLLRQVREHFFGNFGKQWVSFENLPGKKPGGQ